MMRGGLRKVGRPVAVAAEAALASLTTLRTLNGERVRLPRGAARYVRPFVNVPYEIQEWRPIVALGRAGQTFVDIGANIGVLAMAMSRVAGAQGRVLAIEPQPRVYCLLTEALRMNGCENATSMQALVLDRCGVAKLCVSTATPLGVGSSVAGDGSMGAELLVPAVTIDALFEAPATVDYVKIDAEGAERTILAGAADVLARARPLVQVEVHGQYYENRDEGIASLFGLMEESGYWCLNLADGRPTSAAEFAHNTGYTVIEPSTGRDLARFGYGQVLFVPVERDDVMPTLQAWERTQRPRATED